MICRCVLHVILCIAIPVLYIWHTEAPTHIHRLKGFMESGWWRVNRPEEMEGAHRGEWWEEMMRMMSAEWLASGTDPVRLSAEGVEDRERERDDCREDKKETEHERAGEKRRSVSKYYYPVTAKVFPVLCFMTAALLWSCAAMQL